jgi:hypothetical protein
VAFLFTLRRLRGGFAVWGDMLRDALFIARADVRYLLSRRETLIWTFVMPVVFFYFIGTVQRRNSAAPAAQDPLAVSAAPDAGFLGDQLIARLQDRGYGIVRVNSPADLENHDRGIEIPAGFTASVLAGHPMQVRFSHARQDSPAISTRCALPVPALSRSHNLDSSSDLRQKMFVQPTHNWNSKAVAEQVVGIVVPGRQRIIVRDAHQPCGLSWR